MMRYFLLAYEEKLTTAQIADLSEMSLGRTIEPVDGDHAQTLHHALYVGREGLGEGYLYRLYIDEVPPGIFYSDPMPFYIGRFKHYEEVQGAMMSNYIRQAYYYKTSVKEQLAEYEKAFEASFGYQSEAAEKIYNIIETEQSAAIERIKKYFRGRKVDL
jgi:hypothetical protein